MNACAGYPRSWQTPRIDRPKGVSADQAAHRLMQNRSPCARWVQSVGPPQLRSDEDPAKKAQLEATGLVRPLTNCVSSNRVFPMSALHTAVRRFLSKKAVAERHGVHPATISKWVREGRFPPPIKLSEHHLCRWPEHVIVEWEDAQVAKSNGRASQAAEREDERRKIQPRTIQDPVGQGADHRVRSRDLSSAN